MLTQIRPDEVSLVVVEMFLQVFSVSIIFSERTNNQLTVILDN